MSKPYIIKQDGDTEAFSQVMCKDEDKELQSLLEKNHDLMPGDQIRPEDPRRWFLIKREMPVHDPGTGEHRWSIDFFFVDQSGTPTFVECKRFLDTRSRREVVGQMFEYAANGHHYWTQEAIRDLVIQQYVNEGSNLEEVVRAFEPDTGDSVDDFFDSIENNLREGQIRLVFFLEEAPHELKSIVDFLNKQMERTEVLIVEAKQFEKDGLRIVFPTLFGYTEQARRVKKTVKIESSGRRKWNEQDFFEQAKDGLDQEGYSSVLDLYDFAKSKGHEIKWGTGKQSGSFSVLVPDFHNKSIISVSTTGKLWLNFGALYGDENIEGFRDALALEVTDKLSITLPGDLNKRYPSVTINQWAPKREVFIHLLDELILKFKKNQEI